MHFLRLFAGWWTSRRPSAPQALRQKRILQMLGGWGRREQPSDSQKDYRKLQECHSLMKVCPRISKLEAVPVSRQTIASSSNHTGHTSQGG